MPITKELVDQINALARKKRAEGLTATEKQEQQKLRQIYLKHIRQQVVEQLETIKPQKNIATGKNACACGCNNTKHKHK